MRLRPRWPRTAANVPVIPVLECIDATQNRSRSEPNDTVKPNSGLAEEEWNWSGIQARLAEIDRDMETRLAGFADFEDSRFRVLWNAVESDCRAHQAAA